MTALAVLGGIVGVGFLMFLSAIFSGYVLSVLWGWFVVPTFGAPALGVVPAIGIAIVVSYMTHQVPDGGKKRSFVEAFARDIVVAVVKPSFALFFGWIAHLFM